MSQQGLDDLMDEVRADDASRPSQFRAEQILRTARAELAGTAQDLGYLRDCLNAKSHSAIRDAIADEMDKFALEQSYTPSDMATLARVRDIIADQIAGCTFEIGDMRDATRHAEVIIVELQKAGFDFTTKSAS